MTERFEDKILKTKTCWFWQGARFNNGYGSFWLNGRGRRAHRVSWVLYRGRIPENRYVLHRCDNPPCVNPAHLFLGTLSDNSIDRDRKGRGNPLIGARGEKSCRSKLTEHQVREIICLGGVLKQKDIATRFSVTPSTVCSILKNKRWRHVERSDNVKS